MKRIDTVNARPDVNGVGKDGFHDNADVSGQDATYLDPSWCNHVQEEIANVIEGFGVELDGNNKAQLFEAIQNAIGAIPATDISGKYDKTGGVISGNASIVGSVSIFDFLRLQKNSPLAVGPLFINVDIEDVLAAVRFTTNLESFNFNKPVYSGGFNADMHGYTPLLNGLILQWGKHEDDSAVNTHVTFPIAFPTACLNISATAENTDWGRAEIVNFYNVNTTGFDWAGASGSGGVVQAVVHGHWLAIGY